MNAGERIVPFIRSINKNCFRLPAEIGAYIAIVGLLNFFTDPWPMFWTLPIRLILPIAILLALRRLAFEPWKIGHVGLTLPPAGSRLEAFWLLLFQAAYVLGLLLLLVRFRYYDVLDFLMRSCQMLNGYYAGYAQYVFSVFLYLLTKHVWQSELLLHGYIQNLSAHRSSAASGALASWIVFGAVYASEALAFGCGPPAACIWGLLAVLPGPLHEAYYLRHRNLLPLVVARTGGNLLAMASIGFFLYWYPQRSCSIAMPVFYAIAGSLGLVSAVGLQELRLLLGAARRIMASGGCRGFGLGSGFAIILLGTNVLHNALAKTVVAVLVFVFFIMVRKRGS